MIQQYPSLPSLQYVALPQGGFAARDTRTGAEYGPLDERGLHQLAARLASAPGHYGAGDVIAGITHALGIQQCTPCARRQAAMNAAMPRFWRR